ncbi:hypothetical protein HK098_002822 [Nowakowskiella sp. JEL0407]|nr:hypothetical protein HK098_002822 [Nowakowskiella sp. JEL0407]
MSLNIDADEMYARDLQFEMLRNVGSSSSKGKGALEVPTVGRQQASSVPAILKLAGGESVPDGRLDLLKITYQPHSKDSEDPDNFTTWLATQLFGAYLLNLSATNQAYKYATNYITVSHLWGSHKETSAGTRFNISWKVRASSPFKFDEIVENVKKREGKWLWIDALCVDQSNVLDKN